MSTTERHYSVHEAAFMLRILLGPLLGSFYSILADQRRGRKTKLPIIPYQNKSGVPYYLSTELMKFVDTVRAGRKTRKLVQAKVKPVFREVDLEKEMSL